MLEGFNHADRRLLERADELGLKNALVLVEDCPQWWCYGSVFWMNSPNLDGDIVWAERSSPALDSLLIDSFEDRTLYLADYSRHKAARERERVHRQTIAGGGERQVVGIDLAIVDEPIQARLRDLYDGLAVLHLNV